MIIEIMHSNDFYADHLAVCPNYCCIKLMKQMVQPSRHASVTIENHRQTKTVAKNSKASL